MCRTLKRINKLHNGNDIQQHTMVFRNHDEIKYHRQDVSPSPSLFSYIGTTKNDENDKALLGAQRALAHFVVWYPWRGLCHRRFEATKEYQKLVGEQSHRIYG